MIARIAQRFEIGDRGATSNRVGRNQWGARSVLRRFKPQAVDHREVLAVSAYEFKAFTHNGGSLQSMSQRCADHLTLRNA